MSWISFTRRFLHATTPWTYPGNKFARDGSCRSCAIRTRSTTPAPVTSVPAQANPAGAAPVASGKRFACKTAAQGLKGQEQKDQLQVCMMQARLDCLKQAIDQKLVSPQRKDFVKYCAE